MDILHYSMGYQQIPDIAAMGSKEVHFCINKLN